MCGICGLVHPDRDYKFSEQTITSMRDRLAHRGPDDAGEYIGPGVALGARRLAILDLSERGHMPMGTPDGRYWIVYNGETYNYRELRAGLEARGHRFRSDTDTEVVLHLYADEGPRMLNRLNGMFAFAVWDSKERTLFAARDRLGIKPFFYAFQSGIFHFASEEKALFAAGVPARLDADSWEELLCFRYVGGENTPFVGVKRLLPGHYAVWKDGTFQVRRWWNLAERARARRENLPKDPVLWFQETFEDSVRLHRISDVPVGVLLSGGVDSGSLAASLAPQAGSGVASFTVRFDEPRYDEGLLARATVQRWGLEHHELTVSQNELDDLLWKACWLNDEPLAHASDCHLLAIATYAKQHVTVLLSGEGSDETLSGYVRYQPLQYPKLVEAARSVLPRLTSYANVNGRLRKLARFASLGSLDRFVLFNACETLPDELRVLGIRPKSEFPFREQVLAEARSIYPGEPLRQAMYSDQHTFLCSLLDRNDRMTMGASIECRVPFLDYRLVEGAAALPSPALFSGLRGKGLLRKSFGRRLPASVQRFRKWGFGVPWTTYLRGVPVLHEILSCLPEAEPFRSGPFERSGLRSVVSGFLRGDNVHEALVRQLAMIRVWYAAYFSSTS
ncbi:MAG: asparagine synthase (glutamine-hydrolyzing) [Acidobacteria bacterium]|nr:asparagine synthase (glutamine-hydrolyzing) [Acidobacteriota bacterium]